MFEIFNLSYQTGTRWLLKNFTQTFLKSKLYGIIGPNGAGKTTLLKLINGLLNPTTGSIIWDNSPLEKNRMDIARVISMVPQNPYPLFDFNVIELISMGAYGHRSHSQFSDHVLKNILEQMDLWTLRKCTLNKLSCGERQRCYIARALIADTPIILLDEPGAALDIGHKLQLWELLKKLAHQQSKLLIATLHDLDSAERFCDELLVLSKGECVARGTFNELLYKGVFFDTFQIRENALYAPKGFEYSNGSVY